MSKKRFRLEEASYFTTPRSTPHTRTQKALDGTRDIAGDTSGATIKDTQFQDDLDSGHDLLTEADRTQVELWSAELVLLTKEFVKSLEVRPATAVRILSLWARLSRVEPRALPVPTVPNGPLSEACGCVRDNAAQLAEAYASTAAEQAKTWLERAGRLQASYHDAIHHHPREQERNATSLLHDLDDMELARCAAAELRQSHSGIDDAVHRCRCWLGENVHSFLSCGKIVEAELRIMRQDLPTADPALSQTIHKYLQIRSAIEEMDRELSFGEDRR